jgi:hypothetical protein
LDLAAGLGQLHERLPAFNGSSALLLNIHDWQNQTQNMPAYGVA